MRSALGWARAGALGALLLSGMAAARPVDEWTGVVNLNAASVEELDRLPGVGVKAAQKIVGYRDKRRFARVEELVRVKGFGKRRFAKLKPLLSVEGPTTLARKAPQVSAPAPPVR